VSAFSGTLLQSMVLNGFNDGITIGIELQDVLRTIAGTIPSEISPLWINWIIVKTSVTAPTMYMCVRVWSGLVLFFISQLNLHSSTTISSIGFN
jgi:hypothetical protein